MNLRKSVQVTIVCFSVLGMILYSVFSGIWSEYGGHNLNLAVAEYVEANDGAWPKSWRDIEPYHADPVLGVETTFFVRKYWSVAWRFDPSKFSSTESGNSVHVVYKNSVVSAPRLVDDWKLSGRLAEFYGAKTK